MLHTTLRLNVGVDEIRTCFPVMVKKRRTMTK